VRTEKHKEIAQKNEKNHRKKETLFLWSRRIRQALVVGDSTQTEKTKGSQGIKPKNHALREPLDEPGQDP